MAYRYGFNGQENNWEVKGWMNSLSALHWEYDSRLGKRWNLDPVVRAGESPYAAFHNSPIMFNDPFGDDPPKKPGFWTRLWRGANHDFYKTRAENYANEHNIDEENIVKLDNSWVVVDNSNTKDVRYSVFRKSHPDKALINSMSSSHDDVNLSTSQLLETKVSGNDIITFSLPQASAASGVMQMGNKGKSLIVGVLEKTSKTLQAYGKQIRFGVVGHEDVLIKGVHLHFDDVVAKMELALRPTQNGGVALVQVGKLVGTADDVKKAVSLFNQAMNSAKFRSELLVRVKGAQEYVQKAFQFSKNSQLAIDKAHEFNYLIKALEKL